MDDSLRQPEGPALLSALYQHARVGVIQVASDGRLHWVNEALCRILGYSPKELLDRQFEDLLASEDKAHKNILRIVFGVNGGINEAEERLLHHNGLPVWTSVVPLSRNGDPRTIRTSVVSEVSETKAAQLDFGSLVALTPNATMVLGGDDRIVLVNRRCEELFGYLPGELIGQSIEVLVPGELPGRHLAASQEILLNSESSPTQDDHEIIGRRKNGADIALRIDLHDVTFQARQGKLAFITDISERKKSETALRESDERFRTLFNDAPVGMALTSLTGRFIFVNRALCELLGYGRNDLATRDLLLLIPPEDRENAANELKHMRQGEAQQHTVERRYIRKDGGLCWAEVRESLIRDSLTGNPKYLLCHMIDVSERKRVEEELRRSQVDLKEAQRIAQVGSWTWERRSGRVWWSGEMYRIHGLDPTLPPPSPAAFPRIFTAGSWAQIRSAWKKVFRTGKLSRHDLELVRADGTHGWISIRGEAESDSKGHIVRLHGTAQDVTDAKKAEQALRETEERFRTIANSAPVLIWMADTEKFFKYFNRPWLEFTGRTLESEVGDGWTEGIHPEDRAFCLASFQEHFDRRIPFTLEYRLRRHDGDYRWIQNTGVPRWNPDGSFAGYIGSCIDQTERRETEEANRNVSKKLIEAQEKERRRIARELHDDINQRLAMLAIELQQLQPTGIFRARSQRAIERLFRQTTEISSAVQALSHELHSSSLEHLGLVTATHAFCNEFARLHKVKIEFIERKIGFSIPADISLALFRVLQEGLHNALKHSGARHFKVELAEEAGVVQLRICDSGLGFDPKNARGGEGLGLVSMNERILPLKGSLSVISRPKRGTELIARVPVPDRSLHPTASAGHPVLNPARRD